MQCDAAGDGRGFAVPVMESILGSIVVMLSVMLSWLPTAPAATNEMGCRLR